jgi:hypothetical protein
MLRWIRFLLVAIFGCLLPSTTTASAATVSYDTSTIARVGEQPIGAIDASSIRPSGRRDGCASTAAEGERTSTTTSSLSQIATNTVDDVIGAACSFSGETRVLMANGTRKPISEVKEGDYVYATDPQSGESGPREVIATLPHTDQLLTLRTSSGDVVTTEDHKYWNATDREWQESQYLDEGDQLLTADGDEVTVEGLDWTTVHTAPAYDLTIDDVHTFYVAAGDESVLVHNCIRWSSPEVGRASRALDEGSTGVNVANRSQAEELFLGKYQGAGYRNTTGMSATEAKDFYGSKAGTYHWDGPDPNHGNLPHLQIHTFDGDVIRIFYPG